MQELNLKLTNHKAIELGTVDRLSNDIKLSGIEKLKEIDPIVRESCDNGLICEHNNTFKSVIGEDNDFYYLAQLVEDGRGVILSEVGIGRVKDGILNRNIPIFTVDSKSAITYSNKPKSFFHNSKGKYIVVTNYSPKNFEQLLFQRNSVIATSNEPLSPIVVKLESDTVLGRFGESEISAISIESISDKAKSYITDYTKQLILKSSQINVRKVKTKQLLLEPHDKPDEKTGTLYYNKTDDVLTFFNGKEWRVLVSQPAD